jgi:hypothetical protein
VAEAAAEEEVGAVAEAEAAVAEAEAAVAEAEVAEAGAGAGAGAVEAVQNRRFEAPGAARYRCWTGPRWSPS